MSPQAVSLFINPTAGRGRAGKRLDRILELLAEKDVATTVIESCAVGDLEKKVAAAVDQGIDRIIVAGGDGSIHEAVNGIMQSSGHASLGVVPSGTGNDFAKACGIALDWQHATRLLGERIAAGAPFRRIDVGRMNGRYFANGAGLGFDAKVTRIARAYRWPIGDVVYLLAILRCLYDGVATPAMQITGGGDPWQGPATLVGICNGAWVGGMFHIAPGADNSDGNLDLMIAAPVSRTRILALLPKLMRGQHVAEAEISQQKIRSVTIHAAEPVESHLDGEVQPLQTDFKIDLLPAALDLL